MVSCFYAQKPRLFQKPITPERFGNFKKGIFIAEQRRDCPEKVPKPNQSFSQNEEDSETDPVKEDA